ncbi:MAG: hypothetical protein Q7S24_01120 [bacterium]|nr:hypothetical protein [bacterium]
MPLVIDTPFGFSIDLSFWIDLFQQSPAYIINSLFAIAGWTVLALIFFFMAEHLWVHYRVAKKSKTWQWVLLAVDVPALLIQTPKAVEQIFAHLSGAQIGNNIEQKYWTGRKQKYFSFEIISIEGYIQFLVRTELEYRDLVEAAVYAQYPEAEITEVEDYVSAIPDKYPNDTHNVFGLEFHLNQPDAYPIRTYPHFEYNLSKDAVFSDPMAAILENFTRIGKGENCWFQIIIEPTGSSWKEKGIELVKKLIANKKEEHKSGVLAKVGNLPFEVLKETKRIWDWNFEPSEDAHVEPPAGKVSDLSPGMKGTIEAIEEKIARIGFKAKIRLLYAARNEVFNPGRCIDGFVGALSQFTMQNRNAIVPGWATIVHYAFKKERVATLKRRFVQGYKKRKVKSGLNPYVLNIEELATLWHFPLPFVKTPSIQRSQTKRSEPPMNLPIESLEKYSRVKKVELPEEAVESAPLPPEDLPYG